MTSDYPIRLRDLLARVFLDEQQWTEVRKRDIERAAKKLAAKHHPAISEAEREKLIRFYRGEATEALNSQRRDHERKRLGAPTCWEWIANRIVADSGHLTAERLTEYVQRTKLHVYDGYEHEAQVIADLDAKPGYTRALVADLRRQYPADVKRLRIPKPAPLKGSSSGNKGDGGTLAAAKVGGTRPEPLTDCEGEVLDLILQQPAGKGITGKAILTTLDKQGTSIDEDHFRGRIIPRLKRDFGVKNRRGAGYYV